MLHSHGLLVGMFRADCGIYSEDIIRTVDGNCRVFYIRASNSASMYSDIQGVKEWKRVEIESQETEVASFMCTRFMEDSHYRIVVQRTKVEDGEPDLFGERYVTAASSPTTGTAMRGESSRHTTGAGRGSVISRGSRMISDGNTYRALS